MKMHGLTFTGWGLVILLCWGAMAAEVPQVPKSCINPDPEVFPVPPVEFFKKRAVEKASCRAELNTQKKRYFATKEKLEFVVEKALVAEFKQQATKQQERTKVLLAQSATLEVLLKHLSSAFLLYKAPLSVYLKGVDGGAAILEREERRFETYHKDLRELLENQENNKVLRQERNKMRAYGRDLDKRQSSLIGRMESERRNYYKKTVDCGDCTVLKQTKKSEIVVDGKKANLVDTGRVRVSFSMRTLKESLVFMIKPMLS